MKSLQAFCPVRVTKFLKYVLQKIQFWDTSNRLITPSTGVCIEMHSPDVSAQTM